MKKFILITSVLLALVLGGLLAASCTEGEFEATVTVQPPGGSTTVLTPTFTVPPPDIPHTYIIEESSNPYVSGLIGTSGGAICFECHGNIPQHNIWLTILIYVPTVIEYRTIRYLCRDNLKGSFLATFY